MYGVIFLGTPCNPVSISKSADITISTVLSNKSGFCIFRHKGGFQSGKKCLEYRFHSLLEQIGEIYSVLMQNTLQIML